MGIVNVIAPIEVDVTQVNKTWFSLKKKKDYTPQYVIGFYQRVKKYCRIQKLPDNKAVTVEEFVRENILPGATLYCEEGILPDALKEVYKVHELKASEGEHVRGEIHINNLKNAWKDLKRNIKREHFHVSPQHLQGYCDHVAWHINNQDLSPGERFELAIRQAAVPRVTYKELVNRNPKKRKA
jgi:hypothetical protein